MMPVLVTGTRPDWIKIWPVYEAFLKNNILPFVVNTTQHGNLLLDARNSLYMPIHSSLKLPLRVDCTNLDRLAFLYGDIYQASIIFLMDLSKFYDDITVFVNGDTTSSSAFAMAAFHMKIPIAHIEAGLRSYNTNSPFPEEINRCLIDSISTYGFAPCLSALYRAQLSNKMAKIIVTGNTIIDSLKYIQTQIPSPVKSNNIVFEMHRRETSPEDLSKIISLVIRLALKNNCTISWPAHLKPEVQSVAKLHLDNEKEPIIIHHNLSYKDYITMLASARLLITDSGGSTEEAIELKVPSIQVRNETDRPEAITLGYSVLGSKDLNKLEQIIQVSLEIDLRSQLAMIQKNPYGDGKAGERIVNFYLNSIEGELKECSRDKKFIRLS